jgi:hypothetical protein
MADDMVDTNFFFLCLGHGRDLLFLPPFTYLGVVDRILARETQDGKILLVGLVQCNCDMLEPFVSCSCYLPTITRFGGDCFCSCSFYGIDLLLLQRLFSLHSIVYPDEIGHLSNEGLLHSFWNCCYYDHTGRLVGERAGSAVWA